VGEILVIHPRGESATSSASILGREVDVRRLGCNWDFGRARALIAEHDGRVEAIALESMPARLQLGSEQVSHEAGLRLTRAARKTPIVDGSGIRSGIERWAVMLAERAHPGIFAEKRVLMVPGLNHSGLAHALASRTSHMHYADPAIFIGFPRFPGVGSPAILRKAASPTLRNLRAQPMSCLVPSPKKTRRLRSLFNWAEVLAGDVHAIRSLSDGVDVRRKIVVVESAADPDLDDLRDRGVSTLVTLMPSLDPADTLGRMSAATLEALLASVRRDPRLPLTEDTYLDMISELNWEPGVKYLQPGEGDVNRFAFVIHPLELSSLHKDPRFRWTRFFPDAVIEPLAARMPPFVLSKITGAVSPTTGQRVEGHLIALGATPRQIMRHKPGFTYKQLNKAARIAQAKGARLMGLGAFTSVVGDAGVTVAKQSPVPITSGNSLTVAATLESAKVAAIKMGAEDLSRGKAMIIGATGSIGSVCSRMLAQAIRNVVLVSIEPERLIELKRTIQREIPGSKVTVSTHAQGLLGDCDVIVSATSAFGERILDISQCKPGAIICDVARPPDINAAEAALRPDVLVIESGEVLIPGDIETHYDIGLPPKVAFACLAETALLAMEGRFESYTLGRELSVDRVKEIYRMFKKHGFQLAGLRSPGKWITDDDLIEKRKLADELRSDPQRFAEVQLEAARKLAKIPVSSKGVPATGKLGRSRLANGVDALTSWLHRFRTGS